MAVRSEVSPKSDEAIFLRQGRLSDLKALLTIEQAAFGQHALDPATIFWLLLRRWPGLLVAEWDGSLAGYVIARVDLLPWSNRRGGVTSVAVHPKYRRQGIGRSLMQAAIYFLRHAKVTIAELEVGVKNVSAISLYREFGFAGARLLPDYYGPGQDGLRMTLALAHDTVSREDLAGGGRKSARRGAFLSQERNKMTDCILCKVARGEMESKKVYEDEDIVAFHDINKKAPVHVLIVPRKHIPRLLDISPEDEKLIGRIHAVANILAKELGVAESGFRVVVNCNRDAGQSIDHLHYHLLGGRPLGWPPG